LRTCIPYRALSVREAHRLAMFLQGFTSDTECSYLLSNGMGDIAANIKLLSTYFHFIESCSPYGERLSPLFDFLEEQSLLDLHLILPASEWTSAEISRGSRLREEPCDA
jgi:hypothetical protein